MIESSTKPKRKTRPVCKICLERNCKCYSGKTMTCRFCGESEISYFLDGVFKGTTKFQTVIENKQEYCGLCNEN